MRLEDLRDVLYAARTLGRTPGFTSVAPLTLKGQNVLVLKVVNEVNNWQACVRFLKDGQPVTSLRIATAPQ